MQYIGYRFRGKTAVFDGTQTCAVGGLFFALAGRLVPPAEKRQKAHKSPGVHSVFFHVRVAIESALEVATATQNRNRWVALSVAFHHSAEMDWIVALVWAISLLFQSGKALNSKFLKGPNVSF
jgi:hypothetical protein